MKRIAMACALVLAASTAAAGPIYRCGPNGRTFSQVPCTGGTIVESSDPRSAAQRAEARRLLAAQRKAEVEKERERREAEKPENAQPADGTASQAASAAADDAIGSAAGEPAHAAVKKSGNVLSFGAKRAASAAN